jgi:SAM-dependent methyltransferase
MTPSRRPEIDSPALSRERVSAHWGDAERNARLAEIHWMGSPVVRAYLNRLASGDPQSDWLGWAFDRWVRGRGLEVLVLGCGEGWLERSIAGRPEIRGIDACDVAAEAVETAAATAREAGLDRLRYHVVDLNHEPLPRPPGGGAYDLVIAHSVLHHVENLERCYRQIEAALIPGGLLLVNEYVGPRRFQFTDRQIEVIDGVLARLPAALRKSAVTGGVYPRKPRPSEAEMIATDPSEAVRSDEVERFTRRFFEVLEEVDYGGTVLHHLLYDVVQNFTPGEPRHDRLLSAICLVEEALIGEGLLPSDFALAVARRPRRSKKQWLGRWMEAGGVERPPRRSPRPPRALRPWEIAAATPAGERASADDRVGAGQGWGGGSHSMPAAGRARAAASRWERS